MPEGVDFGLAAVTEDLMDYARQLGKLAGDYRLELRGWTHPACKARLGEQARMLQDWSQEAALASSSGDYWSRLEAAELASRRSEAASTTLLRWFRLGELWNSHTLRPVPESLQGAL